MGIGEILLAGLIVFGLNLAFRQEGLRREYIEANKTQQKELAEMMEEAYYDSLAQYYDSLDIK